MKRWRVSNELSKDSKGEMVRGGGFILLFSFSLLRRKNSH